MTHVMRLERLRQDLRSKSRELLFRCEQYFHFSASQSQIKSVVFRVMQMTRQCQCFHLKVPIGFDVIHEHSGPAEALLQAFGLQLANSLKPPESIGHFAEHQLRCENQFSVENRLPSSSCLRRALDDSHHRKSIQHQTGRFQQSHLNAPCPRESALPEMARIQHHHVLPSKRLDRQEPVEAAHESCHHRPLANLSGLASSNCGESDVPATTGGYAADQGSRGFGGWPPSENSLCILLAPCIQVMALR